MSVRFILGRAGTGKTSDCMKEIREKLHDRPTGSPLIYLVPEHMTFAAEYGFASTPDLGGMTRLNVYSFPRLALRVLQHAGGMTRLHLDEAGIAMLLRKIVMKRGKDFRLFGNAAEQNGFFELLADTLAEFKQYCLTPDQVHGHAETLEAPSGNQDVRDKLYDLSLIYQEFEQSLLGKYVDGEDYLKLMCEKIPDAAFLKHAEIWIDGFQTMTPEEQLAVECLMTAAPRVTILLGCDQIYDRAPDHFSPFRHPAKLFLSLKERAESDGIAIEPIRLKTKILRGKDSALEHLNTAFGNFSREPVYQTDGLTLTEAINRREEVEQTARAIIRLARDKAIRYQEMTVVVRHLQDYRDLVETVFSDYRIPLFIDQKKPMHHHPLIECVRSALEVIQQNWRYEPVFRCVKTDFFIPAGSSDEEEREAFDRLENYVMAYGIYGKKRWNGAETWNFRKYRGLEEKQRQETPEERAMQNELNRARRLIAKPLAAFEDALRKATSVSGQCAAVYQFLSDLAVPQKLSIWAHQAEEQNRLEDAKAHRQAWNALMNLLDQCVEGAGEEAMPLQWFCDVLDTGLDQLQYAQVPPALDQVQISTIDRLRAADWKAVFVLGINEGIIPAKPVQQGLFSDEDRSLLEASGMHVAEGDEEQMALENEWIYRAFTLPSAALFLSYPLASEDGESLKPSPLIGRIQRLFPNLAVNVALSEPRMLDEKEQIMFINQPRKTLSSLAAQIREWQRGYPISDIWWDSYNWLNAHGEWATISRLVLSSLFATNDEQLSEATAQELYGDSLRGSVSRLELFNACPFSQFAAYGLNLREREVYQLAAPDIGQLFHLAIKQMTEKVMERANGWTDLTPELCDQLARATVQRLAPQLQRQILNSSSRYQYLEYKLEQVIARVARVMQRQAETSRFTPLSLEMPFGPGQPIPPLVFKLRNGSTMQIVGRIDRVDKAEVDDRLMLRIVDYKSSTRDLSLTDVYYGLALQMLTYLDVVVANSEKWLGKKANPAGILYFHVHNPFLSLTEKMSETEIEDQLFKSFKMKGLLLADRATLLQMDQIADGATSMIAPFGFKKSGDLYKSSSVATSDEFEAMQRYTQKKIEEAGNQITEGNISIAPYRIKQRVPCTMCAFRAVCQFDQSQNGSGYRNLQQKPDDWLMRQIEEGARADDEK